MRCNIFFTVFTRDMESSSSPSLYLLLVDSLLSPLCIFFIFLTVELQRIYSELFRFYGLVLIIFYKSSRSQVLKSKPLSFFLKDFALVFLLRIYSKSVPWKYCTPVNLKLN